jgi:hypothetical protein
MFYHKSNDQESSIHDSNRANLIKGLQFDKPLVFLPWNVDKNGFIDMFKSHYTSPVGEDGYFIKDVTVLGVCHCNIGVGFKNKNKIYKIGISREEYTDLNKSFDDFQATFIKHFGKPRKRKKVPSVIKSYEWDICGKVEIHHYIMDRFGLAEYLYIEHI